MAFSLVPRQFPDTYSRLKTIFEAVDIKDASRSAYIGGLPRNMWSACNVGPTNSLCRCAHLSRTPRPSAGRAMGGIIQHLPICPSFDPAHDWGESGDPPGKSEFHLPRVSSILNRTLIQFPTCQQWITLRNYSARTRSLSTSMLYDMPDGFPCLSNPPHPDSFFPNLRAVAWYPNNHLAMLPFFRLLCGPTLTSLSAEFGTDPTSLAMLASLSTLCPNIVHISISAETPALHDDLSTALSTSICRWNDLEQVLCDGLTVSAMEHLGQVKNLTSLTACASERMSPSFSPHHVQKSSFSRLQYLHLYAGLLSTGTSALRDLRLTLTDFMLDIFDAEEMFSTPSSLKELFMTLAEACSHDCLAGLYLCIVNPHFPSADSMMTIRGVRPLLNFTHLRLVILDGFSTFSFEDNDIVELASAWPHIEELALSNYVHHPIASLPTLRSLFHLARSCPKLRALSLVVNMTDLTPCATGRDLRSDVLHDLCLGNTPINSPATIARILHGLYPALKLVDLSVWNKEPLNRLAWRNRYQLSWGLVNVELAKLRGGNTRQVGPKCFVDTISDIE